MNIKQAKDYIKNSVTLYLKKDEYGEYRIPVVRQRPIFLLGAPGIRYSPYSSFFKYNVTEFLI